MSDDIAPEIVSDAHDFPPTEAAASGGTENQPKTTLGQKIRAIGERALEKTAEVIKPGRGRPRLDGRPKKSDVVAENIIPGVPLGSQDEAGEITDSQSSSIFDGDIIKTAVSGVTKGLVHLGKSKIADVAISKGCGADQTERILNKCDVTAEEIDSIGILSGRLLKKYNVDTKYGEEAALGCVAAGIGLRFVAAISELKRLPNLKTP